MALVMGRRLLEEVWTHSREKFPEESCGLLIGRKSGEDIVVEEVKKTRNVHPGDRRTGYLVDPVEYLWAEKEAEKRGMEVVGVYHSHPNLSPKPSHQDLRKAIPGYIYLIVSIPGEGEVKTWRLREDRRGFEEVELKVV